MERDGSFTYDKHKIFLYKEDFEKFSEGLADVIDYIRRNGTKPDFNGPENEGDGGDRNYSGVDFEEL